MQVEIDFEVFKALTMRRQHENHSYNDVIRDLLDLKPSVGAASGSPKLSGSVVAMTSPDSSIGVPVGGVPVLRQNPNEPINGLALRGVFLPDGTMLRATYKGKLYQAQIRDGRWLDATGRAHTSPSAAATFVTNTNVNGWRFWEAMRPTDSDWRRLDMLS